jgi:activator of 2-hydroxyglutaryl-CoA dehydratase
MACFSFAAYRLFDTHTASNSSFIVACIFVAAGTCARRKDNIKQTPFFIVTAVKTSNLTRITWFFQELTVFKVKAGGSYTSHYEESGR